IYGAQSAPQTPVASTRSRPSSAPISGSGRSRSSIWRGPVRTAALAVRATTLALSLQNLAADLQRAHFELGVVLVIHRAQGHVRVGHGFGRVGHVAAAAAAAGDGPGLLA